LDALIPMDRAYNHNSIRRFPLADRTVRASLAAQVTRHLAGMDKARKATSDAGRLRRRPRARSKSRTRRWSLLIAAGSRHRLASRRPPTAPRQNWQRSKEESADRVGWVVNGTADTEPHFTRMRSSTMSFA
jgi:hypothetical protein